MKQKALNRVFKHVMKLLKKYGAVFLSRAKEMLKKAIIKFARAAALTVFESLVMHYCVEPLMRYGLNLCGEDTMSVEEFMEGLV